MKRVWGSVVSIVASTIAIGAALPACAENDQSIFIRSALAPSTNRSNGVCTYTNDSQQASMSEGALDVGVRDHYVATLLVGNQLIGRGDPQLVRAEPNRVHLNGAIVRVTETSGALLGEFTASATGVADPQANNSPGYGVLIVTAIDGPTAAKIAATIPDRATTKQVLVNMKAFGRTLGGVDVETGEFQLPIRVCKGCLVSFAGGNDPAQEPQPNCKAALSAGGGGGSTLPCAAGQDEPVPCQLCQGLPACDPAIP